MFGSHFWNRRHYPALPLGEFRHLLQSQVISIRSHVKDGLGSRLEKNRGLTGTQLQCSLLHFRTEVGDPFGSISGVLRLTLALTVVFELLAELLSEIPLKVQF